MLYTNISTVQHGHEDYTARVLVADVHACRPRLVRTRRTAPVSFPALIYVNLLCARRLSPKTRAIKVERGSLALTISTLWSRGPSSHGRLPRPNCLTARAPTIRAIGDGEAIRSRGQILHWPFVRFGDQTTTAVSLAWQICK